MAPSRISGAMNAIPVGSSPFGYGREGVTAEPEVRHGGSTGRAEEHGCRNDAADDDSLEVGVLQRAQQVSREREHARDHPRAPLHRLLQPFAFDPVADPIRKITDDAGVIHVTDAWVIELSERFAFAEEPRAGGLIGEEVDPQAHSALEALVECLEEHPHRRRRDDPLQPVPMTQGRPGLLEDEQWLRAGQRRAPRRRSICLSRPHTSASHQRRLPVGDWSVKNRLHCCPAQRRTRESLSASVPAAERAMVSSAVDGRVGVNWRRH